MTSDAGSSDPASFRWQTWFQRSDQPIFVLNPNRRLLFANSAWEKATGLLLKEVRGQPCRPLRRGVLTEKTDAILAALAPTVEALRGMPSQSHRLLPGIGRDSQRVEMAFLPLKVGEKLLGIIGIVTLPTVPQTPLVPPLPEKWLAHRDMARYSIADWEAGSPGITRVASQIRLAASQPGLPVSIVGATGTGKLHAARTIHHLSERRQGFFACLDCGHLPTQAIYEVLFPSRSTPPLSMILLKDPDALPRELQASLIELLGHQAESRPWLLAAFRSDPLQHVVTGRLLEALHSRLSTLVISLPGLAERKAELPGLANEFLCQIARQTQKPACALSAEALQILSQYSWPNNLHQFRQVLRMAEEQSNDTTIEVRHLPLYLTGAASTSPRSLPLDEILEKVERRLLETALRLTQGHKQKASDLLGIWRARLLRRLETLGIEQEEP